MGSGKRSAQLVSVVLHEPELGGATQSLLRAIPLLEERGWRFTFWVPGEGAASQELSSRGYPVAGAARRLRFSLSSLKEPPGPARRLLSVPGYLRSWRDWARSQDAALIHGNSILSVPELMARPRHGPPVVLHLHEILPPGPRGWLAARLACQTGRVVAVSQATAAAVRRGSCEPVVVHEGTPMWQVAPPSPSRPKLVVGTMGTVCKRKGSDLFVEAAQRVRSEHEGIEFRMAGNLVVGGERPWAEEVVREAARNHIDHRPWVDSFKELSDWDIVVLPARSDPFPLVVLEAMALGKPVVATRVGGIPEQLGDGAAGVLAEPEDPGSIASAVLTLARDPDLRASLGAAARSRAETMFSLE
ncbi:MAG TPA: glycosyltransferase family 4 protein, partial [Thermoleophilaceae bacterium]|nr:glycosyltransferase family 4 protein [Thermoleophilaceae bacterium]